MNQRILCIQSRQPYALWKKTVDMTFVFTFYYDNQVHTALYTSGMSDNTHQIYVYKQILAKMVLCPKSLASPNSSNSLITLAVS